MKHTGHQTAYFCKFRETLHGCVFVAEKQPQSKIFVSCLFFLKIQTDLYQLTGIQIRRSAKIKRSSFLQTRNRGKTDNKYCIKVSKSKSAAAFFPTGCTADFK